MDEILAVGSFAVLGTYFRIASSEGVPNAFMPYLPAQFFGSLAYGLLFPIKHKTPKGFAAGWAVGFCGSFTTFSTWQVDAAQVVGFPPFEASSANERAYAWLQIQIIGFAVPMVGLMFGKHVSEEIITKYGFAEKNADDVEKGHCAAQVEKEETVLWGAIALVTAISVALGAGFTPSGTTFS